MVLLKSLMFDPNPAGGGDTDGVDGGYNPPAPVPKPLQITSGITPFTPTTAPKGGGGGGGGGYGIGNEFPSFDVGDAPAFKGPRFSLPDAESVLNLPGYKFREQQGRDALEHSAAAKGLTRTGGTLKDLASWNQGFASQEYDAEARRQQGAFNTNYQVQKDEYAPQFANWQFLSNAALQKALAQYSRGTVWNNPNAGGGGGGGFDYDTMPDRSQYQS